MKKSKFLITVTVIAAALSLILAGCGGEDSENTESPSATPSASPTESPGQGDTVDQIEFEEVEIDSLDEEKANLINSMALTGGYYYWLDDEGYYTVFIGLGQRPTAGYGIKVLSVEDNEGKTNITVEETEPGEDEMVAQVITYPYTVIRMTGITDNFNIVDTEGNSFELIEVEDLSRRMVVVKYEGLIDNTSIEASSGEETMVFRNDKMASRVEDLQEGSLVRIIYTENDEGQLILESITAVDADSSETVKKTGIYQGLIDGNSLEVLVENEYMALRNSEVETMAEGLEKGNAVEIRYSVSDEGQLILESIKALTEDSSESVKTTRIYQGLIDGNSLEVLVGDVYMALRNAEVETMVEELKTGDEVEIEYSLSKEGQYLLKSIEPAE